MFEVKERDVPEQLVLTEQRHILAPEIPNWMGGAFGRLFEAAGRYGGATGAALAIYHGLVNEVSDGPVEVCVPIAREQAQPVETPNRIEPAHREAYVRITKSLVAFPQILTAYDAVAQWLAARGIEPTGSPREVYFADFMNAGPDDEVVDIAFPI
jgi:hypothetical protein